MSLLKRYLPSREVTPFVIVCLPRTGSNLLGEMLDSHPQILCHMEIFNPKSTYLSRKPHLRIGTKEERDRDPWWFLKKVFEVTDGCRVVGFKLMPDHNNPVLLALLLNRRVRKIVLHRPNVLQTYVSTCIALQTQHWAVRATDATAGQRAPVKVDIDARAFKRYARKVRIFYAIIAALERLTFQRFFHVNYTQLSQDQTGAALLQFLGVDAQGSLQKPLRKQNVSSLEQKVGNYDELRRELSGDARFAAFFNPET